MSIIKCIECGHRVSSRALSCPNCGNPIQMENDVIDAPPVITTQATGKGLKLNQALAAILMIVGLVAIWDSDPIARLVAYASMLIGLVWYVAVRVMVWWRHD